MTRRNLLRDLPVRDRGATRRPFAAERPHGSGRKASSHRPKVAKNGYVLGRFGDEFTEALHSPLTVLTMDGNSLAAHYGMVQTPVNEYVPIEKRAYQKALKALDARLDQAVERAESFVLYWRGGHWRNVLTNELLAIKKKHVICLVSGGFYGADEPGDQDDLFGYHALTNAPG